MAEISEMGLCPECRGTGKVQLMIGNEEVSIGGTARCTKCRGTGLRGEAASKVDHPSHYGGADNPYEVIKVLEAWLTPEEYRGFLKGNVIKYEARARMKGGLEDYEKAKWYQDELVRFQKESSDEENDSERKR